MKNLFVLLLALVLTACETSVSIGEKPSQASTMPTLCLNGVLYYDGYHHFAPAFNPNGTLVICNK